MANNGNNRRGRVKDMNIPVQEPRYRPPAVPPAIPTVYPIELTPEDRLVVRMSCYRGKIVDFAIMQETWGGDMWTPVARIDCCHGTIHRHQFDQAGVDVLDHALICDIPAQGDSWGVVHRGYDDALTTMMDEWEDNLRRWRNVR